MRGSVERLPSGSYRVVIRAGTDPITGKQIKLTETCETEGAALAAKVRMLAQVEGEVHPDRSATVSVLMQRWMDVSNHETTTAYTYAGYIKRTIDPAIGDMPVRKLQHRVDVLDRLYTHLRRCSTLCVGAPTLIHAESGEHDCNTLGCARHVCKGMASSTIRQIHSLLSAALGYAVSWGWIERNPAEYAHPPKVASRRAKPPEPERVARLLNQLWASDIEFGLYVWLAVTTGARRGELAGLRWNRVNLVEALLAVENNYVVRGAGKEKPTKNDVDRRLSLDEMTVKLLSDFKAARAEALTPVNLALPADAFVFSPDPLGSRSWNPDHFSHVYRRTADAVGITEPLKNLRHFNATQLLAAGVDLPTTAGRLGHSDGGATTLRVYASWTKPADKQAAENLARGLNQLRRDAADTSGSLSAPNPRSKGLVRAARPLAEVLPGDRRVHDYVAIAAELRDAIQAGRLRPGEMVPPVDQLATRFGVAASTAQRGVSKIGAEGFVERVGRRWMVIDHRTV